MTSPRLLACFSSAQKGNPQVPTWVIPHLFQLPSSLDTRGGGLINCHVMCVRPELPTSVLARVFCGEESQPLYSGTMDLGGWCHRAALEALAAVCMKPPGAVSSPARKTEPSPCMPLDVGSVSQSSLVECGAQGPSVPGSLQFVRKGVRTALQLRRKQQADGWGKGRSRQEGGCSSAWRLETWLSGRAGCIAGGEGRWGGLYLVHKIRNLVPT